VVCQNRRDRLAAPAVCVRVAVPAISATRRAGHCRWYGGPREKQYGLALVIATDTGKYVLLAAPAAGGPLARSIPREIG